MRKGYRMPVVDTAYIRSGYRNRGFGTDILSDVVARFPNEDIGFSRPISNGMLRSRYMSGSGDCLLCLIIIIRTISLRSTEEISDESKGVSSTFLGDIGLC